MNARTPDDPTAPACALPWKPAAHWRDLLVGRRPEDVLERIMADDPLRLRALAARSIRGSCRFVDADRAVLRAFARIAHGVTVEGQPHARAWIERQVEVAIDDVLADERAAVRTRARAGAKAGAVADGCGNAPGDDPGGGSGTFDVLARPLGLTGPELRRACDAFNRRSLEERSAFFALVVESQPLDVVARTCGSTPTEVARRGRRALEVLLDAAQPVDAR